MSDRSPIDDPFASFEQQQSCPTVTTPTKQKFNDFFENRSLNDTDPFGSHNGNEIHGQEYHSRNDSDKDEHHNGTNGNNQDESQTFSLNNNLFPVDTNENEKGK
ncbi:unnamed protein product [Rotaria socialis]|uniref:Uncharacterized protein n=2 Tax=Rotaria socialis TaxID=392032 RepID=A0A821F1A4_9BILA|nr:unnamed protein product [Rotaria socialis]